MNRTQKNKPEQFHSGFIFRKHIYALIISVLCLMVLLCTACAFQNTDSDETVMKVTFLDVSKGDCILVEKGGYTVLIDAGYDSTASTVLYYLNEHGIEKLDYMMITHYDKDHVGGAAYLAQNLEIGQILLPGYEGSGKHYNNLVSAIAGKNIPYTVVTEDISFTLSDVNFTVYASAVEYTAGSDGSEGNDNECSLVISAVYGDDSFLFAGDIEKAGIKAFLKNNTDKYDVLKMPHHGELEKNTDDLLTSVHPSIAVITDSTEDPANGSLLEMLSENGIHTYRTAESGNIIITATGDGTIKISTEK